MKKEKYVQPITCVIAIPEVCTQFVENWSDQNDGELAKPTMNNADNGLEQDQLWADYSKSLLDDE